jgi:putative transcriptional regulator
VPFLKRWILATLILVVAAVLLPAAVLHAALPPTEPDIAGKAPSSFVGQLLIAAPAMREPFDHAVVLVAQHNRDGALGIIINHPLQSRPIARVLQALGADATDVADDVRIFYGGPVSPGTGFVLHTADYGSQTTMTIDGRVALSEASGPLRAIGQHKGPKKSLLAFGYAGWAPGQLDGELRAGAWVTVPEDPDLVFDVDRAKVWADAVALHKANPK